MYIISIDLELNQPSGTIIELGYIIANVKSKEIKVAKSILVNPKETLNQNIINLTGITQNQVDEADTLLAAYKEMCIDIENLQVSKHPFQWGLDHFELRNKLTITWEQYIFRRRAHDIKSFYQLYQMAKPNSKVISGLATSMKQLGLEWDSRYGPPHKALADSYNTLLTYWNISDKLRKYDEIQKVVK